MRKKLLEILTEKDRTDCISDVLEEHLKFALPYEKKHGCRYFCTICTEPES